MIVHRPESPQLEYLVLGAGPGGLQLAYYLHRRRASYLVLESGERPGTFFTRFPRHRTLISINRPYADSGPRELSWRWDWNSLLNEELRFTQYASAYFPPADDMIRYLGDFAARHELQILFGARVVTIARDNGFHVELADGRTLAARRLVVATGLGKPYIPPIVGVSRAESYADVSIDPDEFVGQRLLVIGKGNSAFETADHLVGVTRSIDLCSPSPLKMAATSHFAGHVRAVNSNLVDTHRLRLGNAILDGQVLEIAGRRGAFLVTVRPARGGEPVERAYDRVLLCAGFAFDPAPFDASATPELSFGGRLPTQTAEWESVNVPGLFFAGTLMQMRDYRRTMSAFIHGFRYNVRALDSILQERDGAPGWRPETLPLDARALAARAVDRLNTSAALPLQPGYFCDAVLSTADGTARWYKDVPVDYLAESPLGQAPWRAQVTLEYGGDAGGSPLESGDFLHPVVRAFQEGTQAAELHLECEVDNDFDEERFAAPLRRFFEREAGPRRRTHADARAVLV